MILEIVKKYNRIYKLFIVFFVIGMCAFFLFKFDISYAISNEDIERRDMLIDTALAYDRKGVFYQYDLYRENKFLAPEAINEYNNSFAVCSTYVFQVYYNTLGIKIPFLSKNHLSNASKLNKNNTHKYIRYYTSSDIGKLSGNSLNDKLRKFEENASLFLEKGDIVTIGYGSNGHTMMVHSISNKEVYVIDNNGFVYDYNSYTENFENNGSINIHRLSDLIGKSFINNGKYTFDAISFIKIIADGKYLSFSKGEVKQLTFPNNDLAKAGKVRYKYKEMDVLKTYSIKNNDCSLTDSLYVNLDGEITYNITIKNNSNTPYSGMRVVEDIDTSKVSFLSSNSGIYSNGKVVFSSVYVGSKSSVTLSYTVKVNNNLDNMYSIIESNGRIDDYLQLKNININIGNTLSNYQKDILLSNYAKISGNTDDGKDYISKLYKKSFNFDLVFDDYISYENSTKHIVKNTKLNNSSKMVIANLYGLKTKSADNKYKHYINIYKSWRYWTYDGTDLSKDDGYVVTSDPNYLLEYKNRPRNLSYNMLETGDIILNDSKAYLYINNGVPKLIFNSEEYKGKSIDKFLKDLVGDNYVILRPSLNEDFPKKTYKITFNGNGEGVSNIPAEEYYAYSNIDNCKFSISNNIPKREGYVFNGWMLDSNKDLIFQPGVNWKQSNARDYVLVALWKKENTANDNSSEPNDKNNNSSSDLNDSNDKNNSKVDNSDLYDISTEKIDEETYKVTIKSKDNKEFKEVDGFVLSEDKTELSKVYKDKVNETVVLEFEDMYIGEVDITFDENQSDNKLFFIIIGCLLVALIFIFVFFKRRLLCKR